MLSSLDRWLAPAPDPARVAWLRDRIYAHRGLHGNGRVENSRSAFAAAIDAGLGIECDVQVTADGRAVVFHDFLLKRMTAKSGAVAACAAVDLARVALSGSRDTIPGLRDLLDQIGGVVPLLIELKIGRGQRVEPLCRAVRDELEGYCGGHAVMSFDPRVSSWFARHSAATVRGLVVTEAESGALRRRVALWSARPDFLACDVRDLPSPFAAAQRRRGLPVLTWTVSTAPLLEQAQAWADAPIAEAEGLAAACAAH